MPHARKTVTVPPARAQRARRWARWALAAVLGAGTAGGAMAEDEDLTILCSEVKIIDKNYNNVKLQGKAETHGGSVSISKLSVTNDDAFTGDAAYYDLYSGARVHVTTVSVAENYGTPKERTLVFFFKDGTPGLTIDNFSVNNADDRISFQENGTVTLGTGTVTGALDFGDGTNKITATLTGTATNNGSINVRASAAFTVAAEATLDNTALTSTAAVNIYGNFTNAGKFSSHENGTVNLMGGGIFTNTGTFKIYQLGTANLSGGTFNNTGTFEIGNSLGGANLSGCTFNNTGIFNISGNSGTANLSGGTFTNTGTFKNNGSAILKNGNAFTNTDTGTFENTGVFELSSGTFTNHGTFNNIYNSNPTVKASLSGATFTNHGTFNNNKELKLNANAVFTNHGTFNNADTGTVTVSSPAGGIFTNRGTISNNGTFKLENGNLANLDAEITGTGTISVSGGALEISGNSRVENTVALGGGRMTVTVTDATPAGTALVAKITGATDGNFKVVGQGGRTGAAYTVAGDFDAGGVRDLNALLDDRSAVLDFSLRLDGGRLLCEAQAAANPFTGAAARADAELAGTLERLLADGVLETAMPDVAAALSALRTPGQVRDALTDLNSTTAASGMNALRAAQNAARALGTFVADGFARRLAGGTVAPRAESASAGGAPVSQAGGLPWHGYIAAIGDFGSTGSRDGVAGADFRGFGLLTGMERALGRDWTLGLSFSWSRAATDLNRGLGEVTDDTFRLGVYGQWEYENFYVLSAPSAGLHLMDTRRRVRFMRAETSGERAGADFSWYHQAGLGLELPRGFTFTPSAALGVTYFHDPGYREHGAGGADLRLDAADHWSLLSNVGGRLGRAFTVGAGTALLPEVWGGWEHEYLGADPVRTAFAAAPGYRWDAPAVALPADRAVLGAGVSTLFAERYAVNFRYEARLWDGGCNHQFSLRAGISF